MLQERNEKPTTKGRDLLLVVGLILLAILLRLIMNAAAAYTWGGIVQLGAFVLLIGVAFLLYKKRLSSYRYTLYYQEPPADALDAYGEPLRNPYPTGTLVAAPDGQMVKNTTGNPGLARGGSGDVLAGMLAALLAQGLPAFEAALCAVWLHGAAADACAARTSQMTMLPHDILFDLGRILGSAGL